MFGGVEYFTEGGETGDVPGGVVAEDGAGEVDGRGISSIENGNMAMNYWQITIKGEAFRKGTASTDNVVSAKIIHVSLSETCIPRSKWVCSLSECCPGTTRSSSSVESTEILERIGLY